MSYAERRTSWVIYDTHRQLFKAASKHSWVGFQNAKVFARQYTVNGVVNRLNKMERRLCREEPCTHGGQDRYLAAQASVILHSVDIQEES